MRVQVFLVVFLLCFGCKEPPKEVALPQKELLLLARHESGNIVEYRHELKWYSDSTFEYNSKAKDHGHTKYEKFEGKAYLQSDTLHFSRKDMNGSGGKAVFKNGMLEFVGEAQNFRLDVFQNKTALRSLLDLDPFPDYAIFTYSPKKKDRNTPYDLSEEEFVRVRELIACVFDEQKDVLKPSNDYVKQCIPYRNRKGDIEVRIYLHCKNALDPSAFRYQPLILRNVGNCSVTFVLSFKANYYVDFKVAHTTEPPVEI